MKKLLYGFSALMLFAAVSCTSDEEEENTGGGLSNNPVSGTVYATNFTVNAAGGKAQNITSNGIESVNIYLTATATGCDAPGGFEFPVNVFAPRAVGTHTSNVYVAFKDPNSDDFVTVSGGITVEIISVGNTVVGKVKAASLTEDCNINGRFEVPYCN